jgi:hypothetical protein
MIMVRKVYTVYTWIESAMLSLASVPCSAVASHKSGIDLVQT